MRAGLEERRARGGFVLSRAAGRLDNQGPKGVGEHQSRDSQNSKSLPAGSNSSKKDAFVRDTFAPSGRPLRSCAQPGSPAQEADR
jgi:hypothetical protein